MFPATAIPWSSIGRPAISSSPCGRRQRTCSPVQSAEQLIVTGTLIVSGTASFGGGLTLSGTITGTGSATLSPAASSSWVGGPNSVISLAGGVTVPAGGALTIGISPGDYPNHFLIDSSLHVHGAVIWTYGAVTIRNSAVIVESDGVWEADNDLSLTSDSVGLPTFTNLGTLRKASTGGQMTLGGTIAFANSGTIDLQAGTIAVTSSLQLINSGFLKLAAGTAFQLDKVTLQTGSTFAGPGLLQANGLTTITGNVTVTAPLLITSQIAGTGTLHLDAPATWQANGDTIISLAGGVDVMAGRTLTISAAPNQTHYLIDSSLHTSGTVVWTSGGLLLNGSAVTNEVGGLWDVQGDVSVGSGGPGSPTFTNLGTLRKSAGAGTLTLGGTVVYSNTGTIDLQSGILAVGGQQLTTSGVMQVAAGMTVQLDRVTLKNGSTFGGAGLLHANGVTTITGAVTITTPLLVTGTVSGTGTLHLAAPATWQANGDTIISVAGGVDVMAGRTLTISSAPNQTHYLIDSSLHTSGTVVWTSGGLLLNGSAVTNEVGGLWDVQGDVSVGSGGPGSPTFTNLGTLRKSAGAGTLTLGGVVVYANSGTIDLQSGVIAVGGQQLTTSGPLQVATGTTFQLDRVTLQNGSTFGGAGLLHANGLTTITGDVTVTARLLVTGQVAGAGTLHLAAATTWQANGDTIISVTGGVDVMAGRTLTLSSAPNQTHYLIDSSLHNHGTVLWTSGGLLLNASAVTNEVGGLWDVQSDVSVGSGGPGSPAFANLGTLRKSAGAGTLTLGGVVVYANTGTIDLQSGTLAVTSPGGLNTSGPLQVAIGTTFQLDHVTLQASSTFSGGGLLHANGVTTVPGDLTVTVPLLVTLHIFGTGTLHLATATTWQANGDTIISVAGGVDVMAGRTLTLSSAPNQTHFLIDSSLHNHGTVVWTGGALLLRNTSTAVNEAGGLWDARGDFAFVSDGIGAPVFTNLGILRKSAGPGTLTLGGNVAYFNTGTIDLQSGVVAVGGQQLTTTGLLQVATGTTFQMDRVTLQAGSTVAGTGLLHANGVTTVPGNLTVAAPLLVTGHIFGTGTLHLAAATTWQANGDTIISVAGGVDVMAGRTLTLSSAPNQTHFLIDSSLHNHGTVVWTGGALLLRNTRSCCERGRRTVGCSGRLRFRLRWHRRTGVHQSRHPAQVSRGRDADSWRERGLDQQRHRRSSDRHDRRDERRRPGVQRPAPARRQHRVTPRPRDIADRFDLRRSRAPARQRPDDDQW